MAKYTTTHKLFKFPMKGVSVVGMKNEQPEGTCIDAQNVRAFDQIEDRARGGNRPGIARYFSGTLNTGANRVQDLNYVTTISSTLQVGSLSRRTVIPVAVSDGVIQKFTTAAVTNATVTGTQALGNSTQAPFAFSAEMFQRLYYCDGYGYKMYVGSNNVAQDWTPTGGSLPGDQGNNIVCRLIEQWRGRLVMAGLATDPHNWFMTKLGDPLDLTYFAVPETELDAVQGGNGSIGKVPDVINAIVPYSDDELFFGCDHSIWRMSGDPQAGGRLDLVTNTVGMAFGRPYTQLPDGTLFFFSNRGSVYKMPPGGGKPQNMTETSIDPLITNTNLNTHLVRMAYDAKAEGVHLYITPLTNGAAIHWFYDIRNDGWFKVVFGSNGHNPIALMIFDGDDPDDRQIMLGSETGNVNVYSNTSFSDAGDAFTAFAVMGPIVEDAGRVPTVLTDLQFVMDDTAANTIYEIGNGDTAEDAIADFTATFTGDRHAGDNTAIVVQAGKSVNINPRTRGYFQYFKVGATAATGLWAIEYIQTKYRVVKSSRGRSFLSEAITYQAPGDPPWLNTTGLIFAFWADKNVTTNTSNALQMNTWALYQEGDTGNTKPTFDNIGAAHPKYTASDSLMNSKATLTTGSTFGAMNTLASGALLGCDSNETWMIIAGYWGDVPSIDFGDIVDIKPFAGGDDLSFITAFDSANASLTAFQINDNGVAGGNTSPASGFNNGSLALNTATVVSWGRSTQDGTGWKIRVNGTEVLSANLGRWWHSVDVGAGIDMRLGVGGRFSFASMATYSASKSDAQIRAIEEVVANYYNITLD
jgi:hypothetical protein